MSACSTCGAELPGDARFCPACGASVEEIAAGEMLKLVTVLFADVVGSTTRAEEMHPEDVRSVMADYFAAMSDEITAEGGTIERSEEHTSEIQSRLHLVCRLLLEKKKQ